MLMSVVTWSLVNPWRQMIKTWTNRCRNLPLSYLAVVLEPGYTLESLWRLFEKCNAWAPSPQVLLQLAWDGAWALVLFKLMESLMCKPSWQPLLCRDITSGSRNSRDLSWCGTFRAGTYAHCLAYRTQLTGCCSPRSQNIHVVGTRPGTNTLGVKAERGSERSLAPDTWSSCIMCFHEKNQSCIKGGVAYLRWSEWQGCGRSHRQGSWRAGKATALLINAGTGWLPR